MSWSSVILPGLVLAAIILVPGFLVLRSAGVRGLAAAAAAAPVTFGLLGVASVLFGVLGVPWRILPVLGFLVIAIGVLGAICRMLLRPMRGVAPYRPVTAPPAMTRREALAVAVSLTVAGLALVAPLLMAIGQPDRPLQQWDSVFHLNAVTVIRDTGVATPLGSVAPLYGAETAPPYYPTGWHALIALAPGFGSVAAASNLGLVVACIVPWLLGLAGLTREVIRDGALGTVAAPLLAASFIAFPAVQLTVLAQQPGGLATALLPGVLTVAVRLSRVVATGASGAWPLLAVVLTGSAGVISAHASGAFSLLVLLAPLLVTTVTVWVRRLRPGTRMPLVAGATTAVVLAASPVVLSQVPLVAGVMGFDRLGGWSHLTSLLQVLSDRTLVYSYPGEGFWHLPVTVLTLMGLVCTLARREHRWLSAGFVLTLALATLAAGPEDTPLRWLAGFWYTQAGRIAPVAAVGAVVLAAYGVSRLAGPVTHLAERWRGRREPAGADGSDTARRLASGVILGLVGLTVLVRLPLQHAVAATAYDPDRLAWGTMATAEELDLMERLATSLPAGALVIGDPFNGSALLPPVAGIDVVFRQLGASAMSPAETALLTRLNQIHDDPEVCEAVGDLGVTHLYQDLAGDAEGAKLDERTAGMRDVDVSTGFELVDVAGTASVYRITLCD